MNKDWAKKIGIGLLGLLLIVYLGYHSFVVPYASIKTEEVTAFTARDTILSTETLIIRSEKTVSSDANGAYRYNVSNGERVANNGTIAEIYANSSVVESLARIDDIDRQLLNLKSLSNISGNSVTDIDQINAQIDDSLYKVLRSVEDNDFSEAGSLAAEYLTAVNRRHAVTGQQVDFSAMIANLESQKATLTASVSNPVGTVKAPAAGYFVTGVDGYEDVLTPDGISTLTPEIFDSIEPNTVSNEAVGKVVSDVNWYIAVKVSFEQALQFSLGQSLNIEISSSKVISVPSKIASINKGDVSGSAVVVFSSTYMNSELAGLRNPSVRIIVKSYDGLKVSSKAIKVEDGKKGVYVSNGSTIEFVPVTVLYEGNGYVVCKRGDPLKKELHIYDDVIVKGKDLYDGKSVN